MGSRVGVGQCALNGQSCDTSIGLAAPYGHAVFNDVVLGLGRHRRPARQGDVASHSKLLSLLGRLDRIRQCVSSSLLSVLTCHL